MKLNFIIFCITAFLIANTYYDGKFTEFILKGKKYYKMATFAFVGLSMYIFINKNPGETRNLVAHANDLIKYMTSEPVIVQVLESENAVEKYRNTMGSTNPEDAKDGTIRKLHALNIQENSVHGSDSNENAQIEINFFFTKEEIVG